MDMITLAMAKAYTDEKVASGGGSGGGVCLPVVEIVADDISGDLHSGGAISAEKGAELSACIGFPVIMKIVILNQGIAEIAPYLTQFDDGNIVGHAFLCTTSMLSFETLNGVDWTVKYLE